MLSLPKTAKLERDYEAEILDYLNKRGDCIAWKVSNRAAYDPIAGAYLKKDMYDIPGQADITAVFKHHGVRFFEAKKPKGKRRLEQLALQKRVRALGHHYDFVITVDDVKKALGEL